MSLQKESQQKKSRQQIRISLREKRRSLSLRQQRNNANGLASRLNHYAVLKRAKRIAVYLSNDGEIDLQPTINWIWRSGKQCYLPVLNKNKAGHLFFSPYQNRQILVKNRFGIPEPKYSIKKMHLARQIDVILMPLVGFDRNGNRIGMGGGFYDRTLAYLANKGAFQRPKLIGVAHSLQEVQRLPVKEWDIAMQAIVTEREIIRVNKEPLENAYNKL